MAEPRARFPEIVPGEFVDPLLLHAVVDRPLEPAGDEAAVRLSPEQVLRRLRRPGLPGWARRLPLSARLRAEAALTRAGFDPWTRLDDNTLVAANPDGSEAPLLVLEIGRPGVDLTRVDLFQLELEAAELVVVDPGDAQAIDSDGILRAVAVHTRDLPRALTRHRPGLVLRERLRLALVFDELQLGGPISTLTLLPGERRSVRTVRRSEARVEETSELGTERRDSRELSRSLQREFRRGWERHREARRLRGIVWSREERGDGAAALAAAVRELSGEDEDAWARESSAVREALDSAALSAGRDSEVVRVEEGVRERVEEGERIATTELENRREDRAVTFVAHHVLAVYQAHLDLVDAGLVRHPEDPAAPSERIDLRGDWQGDFQRLGEPPEAADRVAGLLRARYGPLDALRGDHPSLQPTPANAANLDLVRRDTMLEPGRRDRRGPLPVCLLSRRLAIRSGGTFVRTYSDAPEISAPTSGSGARATAAEPGAGSGPGAP